MCDPIWIKQKHLHELNEADICPKKDLLPVTVDIRDEWTQRDQRKPEEE